MSQGPPGKTDLVNGNRLPESRMYVAVDAGLTALYPPLERPDLPTRLPRSSHHVTLAVGSFGDIGSPSRGSMLGGDDDR